MGGGEVARTREGPPDNLIARFRGVSLRCLKELADRVLDGSAASGVQLLVLLEPCRLADGREIPAGNTVRLVRKLSRGVFRRSKLRCQAPYFGEVDLAISAVRIKERVEWTNEDICEQLVLRITSQTPEEKPFYLDHVDPADVGERFEGTFVSQARKSAFGEFVQSLVNFYSAKGKDIAKQFIWLDMFSANQPRLTSKESDAVLKARENLLKHALHDAIAAFDESLIYFNSWQKPYPLQRAWCVWEILGAVKSGKPMDLIFRPGERESFVDALMQDPDAIDKVVMKLRLEDAECFNPADKLAIDQAVADARKGGYHALNVWVSNLINRWLMAFAEESVKGSDLAGLELAKLKVQVAIFVMKHGGLDDALEQAHGALAIQEEILGTRESSEVGWTLRNVARILWRDDKLEEALTTFNEALNILERVHGTREHPDVAGTLRSIAGIKREMGDLESTLDEFRESLGIYERCYGTRKHPEVAKTIGTVAQVLRRRGDPEAALKHYEEALEIKTELYGTRQNLSIAETLACMAEILRDIGDFDAAQEIFEEVLQIDERAFGTRDNVFIGITLHNMARIARDKGDLDTSLRLFHEALDIEELVLGTREHLTVVITLYRLGAVACQAGKISMGERYLEEAADFLWRDGHKPSPVRHCQFLKANGTRYRCVGDLDAAAQAFGEALDLVLARVGEGELETADIQFQLGRVLVEQGGDGEERGHSLLQAALGTRRKRMRVGGEPPLDSHPFIAQILACM